MKHVKRLDRRTMEWTVLATFTLAGDIVRAEYADEVYRARIERRGILTAETGRVRPADGRAFYDALDVAYSNSSSLDVVSDD